MDFDLLPNELLRTVISYLDIKSAKQMSLVSKRMYSFALQRIWLKPRYSWPAKEIDFLEKISQFPISELHTGDFDCTWFELITLVPRLKLLHVTAPKQLSQYRIKTPKMSRLRLLKVPTIVYTKALELSEQEHFSQLSEIIELIDVKELIIDRSCPVYDDGKSSIRFSFPNFEMLVGKVRISEIWMDCLEINDQNAEEFIILLATIKNCRLIFPHPSSIAYHKYTVRDLELMVKFDLKITTINSRSLRTEGKVSKLLEFAKVMKKMKYLEEFKCDDFDQDTGVYAPLELLTDLPIKFLISWNFEFHEGGIEDIAKTLSRMKHLTEFYLQQNYHVFLLSPEELALFKDVPITCLELCVLDLKRDNIDKFQNVMKEMKIKFIEWGDYKGPEDFDFEITVKPFGLGGIYKTISIF
uniref:F-box domain-containing protein n=1 Tax=Clytia hemisphaerica TaxID=252671 RepID=A0A7M5V8S1_9CNID